LDLERRLWPVAPAAILRSARQVSYI